MCIFDLHKINERVTLYNSMFKVPSQLKNMFFFLLLQLDVLALMFRMMYETEFDTKVERFSELIEKSDFKGAGLRA